MKPAFALPLAAALLGATLAGCGQTGPLYMPPALKSGPVPAAAPAPSAPVPTSGQPAPGSSTGPVSSSPAPTQQ